MSVDSLFLGKDRRMRPHFHSRRTSLSVTLLAVLVLTGALLNTRQPRAQQVDPPKPPGSRGNAAQPGALEIPAPPPPPEPGQATGIRRKGPSREDLEGQLRLANAIYKDLEKRCSRGEMIDLEDAFTWSRRIVEYERELGVDSKDRLAPYKNHMMRMRTRRDIYSEFANIDKIERSSPEFMRADFYQREATISLLRANVEANRSPERK
jgi:hypothetical protein